MASVLLAVFTVVSAGAVLFVPVLDVNAQPLSDATGLINRFDVIRDNNTFEISVIANFDVPDIQYDQDRQMLTLYIDSSLDNNIGEVILPIQVLDGDITFEINDQPYMPTLNSNDEIYLIVLNFTGAGDNQLVMYGESDTLETDIGGGCLIATAAFGTELEPQIQLLREIREKNVQSTASGTMFMSVFNHLYYVLSPTVADWERQNSIFREITKMTITPMILSLQILEHADTEPKLVVLGMLIILANIGMYVGLPVAGAVLYRQKF